MRKPIDSRNPNLMAGSTPSTAVPPPTDGLTVVVAKRSRRPLQTAQSRPVSAPPRRRPRSSSERVTAVALRRPRLPRAVFPCAQPRPLRTPRSRASPSVVTPAKGRPRAIRPRSPPRPRRPRPTPDCESDRSCHHARPPVCPLADVRRAVAAGCARRAGEGRGARRIVTGPPRGEQGERAAAAAGVAGRSLTRVLLLSRFRAVKRPRTIQFGILSPDEIKAISVCKVRSLSRQPDPGASELTWRGVG